MEKQKYQTKQGSKLLDYLKQHAGQHITANDISEHFIKEGTPIGVATIYRHLERFAEEGLVLKYNIDNNSSACFEYHVEGESCSHIHCKCEKCGALIHLLCSYFDEIEQHLAEQHSFFVSSKKTVLYGVCQKCQT